MQSLWFRVQWKPFPHVIVMKNVFPDKIYGCKSGLTNLIKRVVVLWMDIISLDLFYSYYVLLI